MNTDPRTIDARAKPRLRSPNAGTMHGCFEHSLENAAVARNPALAPMRTPW